MSRLRAGKRPSAFALYYVKHLGHIHPKEQAQYKYHFILITNTMVPSSLHKQKSKTEYIPKQE